jgi:hypothetical protein
MASVATAATKLCDARRACDELDTNAPFLSQAAVVANRKCPENYDIYYFWGP